ncbi:TrmH family RNA methyltransferase [Psychroflexus tropicus]|uniref:TrmH family RNA methyltransferase n=1 Tax=Psychroflexus tropicus TaxID=197345 RepID=UPI00036E5A08|nr:TrmH family RNA methyltransferase [Psychroflexus tropicus]
MRENQLEHNEVQFNKEFHFEVEVLLDQMYSPANLGSIIRNAEAFGVKTIWIHHDNKKELESNRFKRTSRSADKNVKVSFYENSTSIIDHFNGLKLGIEITTSSQSLKNIEKINSKKVLLALGNEKHGLNNSILNKLDHIFHIEMFGINSSLNVSQSLGIALYELRR